MVVIKGSVLPLKDSWSSIGLVGDSWRDISEEVNTVYKSVIAMSDLSQ